MNGKITPIDIVQIIIVLLISMSIHEAMHAYAGYALGDRTAEEEGRLSLNPFKHIDPFMTVILPIITVVLPPHFPFLAAKPVPFNPYRLKYREYGAALLAVAGPLSNFVLAFIFALILRDVSVGTFMSGLFVWGLEINVVLFVFNLIPIPPLDGSRVLYAFAPESLQEFMNKVEPYGLFIIFALILTTGGSFLGGLYNWVLHLLP